MPDAGTVAVGTADAGDAGASCAVDDDCPFGQICRSGACRTSDGNPHDRGCREDGDCAPGFACAAATGQCVLEPRFPPVPEIGTSTCAEDETRRCGRKIGACEYGAERCLAGEWSGVCEGSVEPADEICDGIDNDCDDESDEGFLLGLPCSAGVGACEQFGETVCAPDGQSVACGAIPLDPSSRIELCGNGADDDCDGAEDEGFMVGGPCSVGLGACARTGITVCTQDGAGEECNVAAGVAAPVELCGNAPDDDCDGEAEEGFEVVGTTCSAGVGACQRSGTFVCSPDQQSVRCTALAGFAGPIELCGNSIDDDCDGSTDEGFTLVGMPCTVGMAPCQSSGVWSCSTDRTGLVCSVPPSATEQCNGADDDQDSCVDEGFDFGAPCSAGVGACRQTGTKICTADGAGTTCSAVPLSPSGPELCGNGQDDDCSGQVDEGFTNLGAVCSAGTGICARSGAFVCSSDRLSTICDAVPGAPLSLDLCGNGLDDDCDAQTDEGFDVGSSCTVGAGICVRSGTRVCTGDGLATTCGVQPGAPNPSGELCGNGLDDDCDTETDEGYDSGATCTTGAGICARTGTKQCSADRLSTACDAVPGAPNPSGELCGNGLDDDCDMVVDEGFGNLGSACTVGVGACARSGTFVCSTDRLTTVCNAIQGSPSVEVCDGVDNDCNGVTDNGCDDDNDDYCDSAMTIVGVPATCPFTVSVATRDCNDQDSAIHPGAAEICNDARDQDCDGNPNNGCTACDPAIDADFDGSNQCQDCDETNGAVRPGGTERCDGIDNDCDGALDEGFDADNDSYTTCGTVRPGGGTQPAYVDCDDANANRRPFGCELCALGSAANTVACGAANDRGNGIDEDCDGYLDETCSPCSTADPDGDGVSQCNGDCAPSNASVSPQRAETCDGLDTDCNQRTTDNCDVGDRCSWPGTPPPDVCRERLVCAEALGPNGMRTGNYSCTSFCNMSPQGLGLGDGCTASQTCAFAITPTANLHGCSVTTDIGTRPSGQTCSRADDCRSGNCLSDQRLTGPPDKYCTDLCGNDAYCSTGSTCQAWFGDTGQCWRENALQTSNFGDTCTSAQSYRCKGGNRMCIERTPGGARFCSKPCCTNGDCPAGHFCSLYGNDSAGPVGGFDTVPACFPYGATGTHNRPSGAACSASSDCQSDFCDQTLGVCFDVCCNDTVCPIGLTCESMDVDRGTARLSLVRMCTNVSPSSALRRMP